MNIKQKVWTSSPRLHYMHSYTQKHDQYTIPYASALIASIWSSPRSLRLWGFSYRE